MSAPDVRVTLVRDMGGLESGWSALAACDQTATPFSSYAWDAAWGRHWGGDSRPWVLAAYEGERLVGLAPLVLCRRRGLRVLRGLGVGVGNYWDVLAAPDRRAPVLDALGRALRERRGEWDALFIDKLPEESGTVGFLRASGLRVRPWARSPSPRIELPATFEEYLAGLSQNRRQKVRRNLRTLDGGELAVEAVSDPDRLRAAIDRWQALRVQWWRQRGQPMVAEHGSARFLAFVQDAIPALVAGERAIVWEVRHGGELAGVAINFIDGTAFYYWLWGFDVGIERLRPGHTLIAHGIRWSIATGRRYFDFMIGDEAYKRDYGPAERAVLSVDVGSDSLRSRVAVGIARAKRAVPFSSS